MQTQRARKELMRATVWLTCSIMVIYGAVCAWLMSL
jgi:hypothetical protein